MSDVAELTAYLHRVPALAEATIVVGTGTIMVRVAREALPTACQAIADLGARLLTVVGMDERHIRAAFTLRYIFDLIGLQTTIDVISELPSDAPTYPSVTPLLPAADWHEREIQDLLGLVPDCHPNPAPLVHHPPSTAGAPSTVYGPLVPGSGDIVALRRTSPGGRSPALEAQFFFAHRGIERLCEGLPIEHAQEMAERICGTCAFAHALAFCRAVERAAGITPPPRAQVWRAILLELERLRTHAIDIHVICAAAGHPDTELPTAQLREELLTLNERIAGARYPRGAIRPGGLSRALPAGAPRLLGTTLATLQHRWSGLESRLLRDTALHARLRGRGALTSEIARRLGAVGPTARASGIPTDSRLDEVSDDSEPDVLPGIYAKILPTPITRPDGDSLARLLLRLDEIASCFRLIAALLDQLPEGPFAIPLDSLAEGTHGIGGAESARGEHIHWLAIGTHGLIERYHVRAASFANWPTVPHAMAGADAADLPLILAGFSLCTACVDR